MKKIYLYQERIFEIAKILKEKIPDQKVYLHQHEKKIVIQLIKRIDKLKLEEIKSFIQIKYPDIEIIFQLSF